VARSHRLLCAALVLAGCQIFAVDALDQVVYVRGAYGGHSFGDKNDDGGLLSTGRYRAIALQSGKYKYESEQGCIIEHIASFSINSAASWTIWCKGEYRYYKASTASVPDTTGYTAKAGWATGAGDVTLRLTGTACEQCDSHEACQVACAGCGTTHCYQGTTLGDPYGGTTGETFDRIHTITTWSHAAALSYSPWVRHGTET